MEKGGVQESSKCKGIGAAEMQFSLQQFRLDGPFEALAEEIVCLLSKQGLKMDICSPIQGKAGRRSCLYFESEIKKVSPFYLPKKPKAKATAAEK